MQTEVKTSEEIYKYIIEHYSQDDTIVFGFSLHFLNLSAYYELLCLLKAVYIHSYFIVGGTYISQLCDHSFDSLGDVDVIMRGAGELPLKQILQRCAINSKNFTDIPNIIWKKDGTYIVNELREDILLKHTEITPYRPANIQQIYGNSELSILTSRGCPGGCTYCIVSGIYKGHWYQREAIDIIREAEIAMQNQVYTIGFFVDDCFLTNKARALVICDLWHKKIHIPFYFAARVCDILQLSKEEIQFLHACGCFRIEVGFESFSSSVLKRYGKGVTAEQNQEAIFRIREAKIDIHADIILWDYEVTVEELMVTLKRLHDNRLFTTIHMLQKLVPMSGTPIYKKYRKLDILFEREGVWDYSFKIPTIQMAYNAVMEYKSRFYERIQRDEKLIYTHNRSMYLPKDIVKGRLLIENLHAISYRFLIKILEEGQIEYVEFALATAAKELNNIEIEMKGWAKC